jgi:hypothetical protein
MATKQASKAVSGASKSGPARTPGQSSPPSGSVREPETGQRDEMYDLVSVLYHALQGAETCTQYVRDAEQKGDEELAEFFEETRSEYAERAAQAKGLLASRLEEEEEEEEEEEDELLGEEEEEEEEEE